MTFYLLLSFPLVGNLSESKDDSGQAGMTKLQTRTYGTGLPKYYHQRTIPDKPTVGALKHGNDKIANPYIWHRPIYQRPLDKSYSIERDWVPGIKPHFRSLEFYLAVP